LTGSWIALVTDSSTHIFYSSKSMNICQIKLIANVWLFSSSSIPCCGFVSEEAVCSIDLNLKNECMCVVSFFFPLSFHSMFLLIVVMLRECLEHISLEQVV
uniref:Uncharacterized protein n=1 Tax=Apteryx owenii TaxID=8824 RepID=A0A8B9QCH9_APTOW